MVHGRCSVKLVLGTGGEIPVMAGVRYWSICFCLEGELQR